MSSTVLKAIVSVGKDKHAVGSLNNWTKDVINLGAIAEEDMDNWNIVELGFNNKGERVCKKLTDVTKKGHLVASVEDYLKEYETIGNFYNAKGERVRIVKLVEGKHYETSLYKLDNSDKPLVNGQKAHWDVDAGMIIVSNGDSEHASYATAGNKFIVVDAVGNSIAGQKTVRFEIA